MLPLSHLSIVKALEFYLIMEMLDQGVGSMHCRTYHLLHSFQMRQSFWEDVVYLH